MPLLSAQKGYFYEKIDKIYSKQEKWKAVQPDFDGQGKLQTHYV
jgi:hypothetical protein